MSRGEMEPVEKPFWHPDEELEEIELQERPSGAGERDEPDRSILVHGQTRA